jgi:membrane protein
VIAFVWFSTRLFAGIRVSLNDIFDVSVRPAPPRHFLLNWLAAKSRDAIMVVTTVVLFLLNTAITIGVLLLRRQGRHWIPAFSFVVTWVGRTAIELVAFIFAVSLFMVTYKYASVRRLPWRTALLASTFTAVLFEVAKRVYGLYLGHFANLGGPSGNANIGAAVLFILWVYYTAIVFLLGGVVAETWELRMMQRRQRAILS